MGLPVLFSRRNGMPVIFPVNQTLMTWAYKNILLVIILGIVLLIENSWYLSVITSIFLDTAALFVPLKCLDRYQTLVILHTGRPNWSALSREITIYIWKLKYKLQLLGHWILGGFIYCVWMKNFQNSYNFQSDRI